MSHPLFSIIDNETRIRLVLCLSRGEKTVTELIEHCGLSQSAVSQHLQKLRLTGIVNSKKEGREVLYSIKDQKIVSLCQSIADYITN